ncbi:hypothetical protein ACFVH0_36140 [Streptomyces sp. NPDC127117]|uniref:hypothetical protein n=1 Tax=Streptomyces sp. NPDC127117 TaxID=3345368 RepID=UPI0036372C28
MLAVFSEMNGALSEVNVTQVHMCRMHDRALLAQLMKRTGTGERMTARGLAAATTLSVGTIGSLLSGDQRFIPREKAERIASAIGVDLMILFVPCERAGRAYIDVSAPEAVSA